MKTNWQNKLVTVIGLGQTGLSVVKYLVDQGAKIYAYDKNDTNLKAIKELQSKFPKLVNYDIANFDINKAKKSAAVVTSPGIKPDNPVISSCLSAGLRVISDIQLAYDETDTPIIAITGTNGKSTTTALISHILTSANLKAPYCGNIGVPIMDVLGGKNDYLVCEVSSYQLSYCDSFSPKIGIWLNLTPDHLDFHGNMENYIGAKQKLFDNLTHSQTAIINYDDTVVKRTITDAYILPFSINSDLSGFLSGIYIKNDFICVAYKNKNSVICPKNKINLIGRHNLENVLSSIAAAYVLDIDPAVIAKAVADFKALEHRLEPFFVANGKTFYNDSKATNPESAINALNAFDAGKKIVLIAGGRDKNGSLEEFVKVIKQKVKSVILLGEARDRFNNALIEHGYASVYMAYDLKNAVDLANSIECDIVLLSPACSSFDMFKNFEERGHAFKDLVQKYFS